MDPEVEMMPAPGVPAALRVTPDTPARQAGDLSLTTWQAVLAAANSPMLTEVEAIVEAARPHGAMCLAQAFKESSLGKDNSARQTHNPFGIMVKDHAHDCLPVFGGALCLRIFPTWAAATADYARRLGTVAPPYDPDDISLADYLATYVGGPLCRSSGGHTCANGETWVPGGDRTAGSINLYLWQTIGRINQWLHLDTPPLSPTAEAGSLVAVSGAIAREQPSRDAAGVLQLTAGKHLLTDGFTDAGENVAGSSRWYRLAADHTWVHSSGGVYHASS